MVNLDTNTAIFHALCNVKKVHEEISSSENVMYMTILLKQGVIFFMRALYDRLL